MHPSMHHQCIHHCTINEFINAFINTSSMHRVSCNTPSNHSSMHHQCIHYCIYQCILNAPSIHHQCIHCIKCINFLHSVLPFIISVSSVHLSMHHNVLINVFINASSTQSINASSMHHQSFNNASSMLH